MGLRTASVRRSHVVDMAPALTEATQSQNFKLPPDTHTQPATSLQVLNGYDAGGEDVCHKNNELNLQGPNLPNAFDNLNTLALASELLKGNGYCSNSSGAVKRSPNSENHNIMNNSPLSMGDQEDKMGLQKTGLDSLSLLKDKNAQSDVDQLFNSIGSVLPCGDLGASGDLGQNVDEIMQVIKSIEASNDRLASAPSDLSTEGDSMFPLSSADLPTNLASLEKELFNEVDDDMMSISMEDQLIDSATNIKETRAQELIVDLQKKQAKMERKIDFFLRRLRKIQSKYMGQHVSGEIAGVFEHVHRTLRRLKENVSPLLAVQDDIKQGGVATSTPGSELTMLETLKPISQQSAKSLVRKLEMSTILQANASSRQRHSARYFGSGSIESTPFRTGSTSGTINLPSWTPDGKQELQKVAGHLHTQLRLTQLAVDSDATASSSGGESCDEMQNYNNPHQQYLSIQKRAAWRYATERAAIASRWIWLQAQISDLEYRIRQHSDLHRQIRGCKGSISLGGASPPQSIPSSPSAVNGYRGQLPGASLIVSKNLDVSSNGTVPNGCPDIQCSRTRPLVNFKKRKLLQINGLHAISKKAARPSTIRCGCVPPFIPCALCTGRTDPTHPRDLSDYLSKSERISLLDPCFHPVFSLPEDTSASIHFEAIMKTTEWQQRSTRSNVKTMKIVSKSDRLDKSNISMEHRPKKPEHRRKYSRLIKPSTVDALTAKIKNKLHSRKAGRPSSLARLHNKRHTAKMAMAQLQSFESDNFEDDVDVQTNPTVKTSPDSSPLLTMQAISSFNKRKAINSYDIDNIVIPYSVAAATRVEKLQYKEILTPKWRLIDPDFALKYDVKNNGAVKESGQEKDVEDLSEESVIVRHDKSEHDEKKKFLSYLKLPVGYGRSRSHKRTDSRAESSGANTPDPMSPHTGDNLECINSPLTSPPATPLSVFTDDTSLPSISVLRRRTVSQSRSKDKEFPKEEIGISVPELDIAPYDRRFFPICDEMYEKMLKHMPENHQFKTNIRSQDFRDYLSTVLGEKGDSPDSESTESALGDEDSNDPEWIDMERYKR